MSEMTTREGSVFSTSETTIREDQAQSLTQREQGSTSQNTSRALLNLPSDLAMQYAVVNVLPAIGGEADVILATNQAGSEVVIKLYRQGIVPKSEVLSWLHEANPSHIVSHLEHGKAEDRYYEILEYISRGSLRDLIESEGPRLDPESVRDILKNITAALSYLHGLTPRVVHRDIKPENILVRSRQPLDLVLTDFGISSLLEQSVHFTSTNRSVRNAAPEAMAGSVSPATDWWSLGVMLVEMLSGRHPFAGLDERVVTHALYERRPIDLLGIADPEWQMLCKGLLCFDAKQRWGGAEISRWLAGDQTLELPMEPETESQASGMKAARPYRISGVDCWTIEDFFKAMALNWDEAVKRVARRTDIERWLLNDLQDQDAYNIFLDIMEVQDADPLTQLSSLLLALRPGSAAEAVDPAKMESEILRTYLQAAAGLAESQRRLGFMFLEGNSFPADAEQAEFWLSSAASQGDVEAQETCRDFSAFRETLLKAETGDVEIWYELGNMYRTGAGTTRDYAKAAEWYRKAAEQGHVGAQNNLGDAYERGKGVPHDYVLAEEWYRKAAEQGDAEAQYRTVFYEKKLENIIEWLTKAAEQNHTDAQYTLGLNYVLGVFGEGQEFKQKGLYWLHKAAEQGHAGAQNNLGDAYERGKGVPLNYTLAANWYRKAAEQGDRFAQNDLGMAYKWGKGVPQDYALAAEWFRKAAEQGHADAQNNLGVAYYRGEGVPQDYALATEWYRKAAEQEQVDAQYYLGVAYRRGEGVPWDYALAAEWFRKAAEQGHDDAQNNLGIAYDLGQGVPQDYALAAEWFRKAAEQGNTHAQNNLGMAYDQGQGVPQDYALAAEWYRKAADQGHDEAQEKLVKTYERLATSGNAEAAYNLAVLTVNGKYVSQNDTEAIRWFLKAAEGGFMLAQREMGTRFATGSGVVKNKRTARFWYKKAIAQGDSESRRLIESVKGWF